MKILRRLLFACFAVGCSPAIADEAQPSLYSFADVYRLTVNAAPEAIPPNQKYSGTSHVHTLGRMTGPLTGTGTASPPRMRRAASATRSSPSCVVRES